MTKSLIHKLCLKQQLYLFRMIESRTMVEQLTNFNKILKNDLGNIKVKLEGKDKALLLLRALLKMFERFKDILSFKKK